VRGALKVQNVAHNYPLVTSAFDPDQACKFSGTRFRLRMSRQEMGSYLGLNLEIVSRMLTQFKREGLIALENREIEIKDVNGLRRRLDH